MDLYMRIYINASIPFPFLRNFEGSVLDFVHPVGRDIIHDLPQRVKNDSSW